MQKESIQLVKRLREMPGKQVLEETRAAAQKERSASVVLLRHLQEVERRKLYVDDGCTSLWQFCVKKLKHSEGSASRRIAAVTLLEELPELEEKVNSGELNLTNLSMAATLFNQEKRRSGELETQEKKDVLKAIENKSTRQVEEALAERSTAPLPKKKEKIRRCKGSRTSVQFMADAKFIEELEQLRGFLAQTQGNLGVMETLRAGVTIALEKLDPARRTVRPRKAKAKAKATATEQPTEQPTQPSQEPETPALEVSAPKPERRTPTAAQVREVFRRDGSQCTRIDPVTGERCASRHRLQIDHVLDWSRRGKTEIDNLQLRCSACHRLKTLQTHGLNRIENAMRRRKAPGGRSTENTKTVVGPQLPTPEQRNPSVPDACPSIRFEEVLPLPSCPQSYNLASHEKLISNSK